MILRPAEAGHQCCHQREDSDGHKVWEDFNFVEQGRSHTAAGAGMEEGGPLRMGEGVALSFWDVEKGVCTVHFTGCWV